LTVQRVVKDDGQNQANDFGDEDRVQIIFVLIGGVQHQAREDGGREADQDPHARVLYESRGILAAQSEAEQAEIDQRDGADGDGETDNVKALQDGKREFRIERIFNQHEGDLFRGKMIERKIVRRWMLTQ